VTLKALVVGTRDTIAGTVYGAIVVLSVLTAGAPAFEHGSWHLLVVLAATVLVFWTAHVYTHVIGESLQEGHRLERQQVQAIARRELAIPLAAVLPMAMITLGVLGAIAANTALWLAAGISVATLTLQGIRYARLERLSRTGTIVSVAINLSLGLALVVVKAAVSH
jgi:hypothetical protein